ncbi:alpha-1,4-glucan--maltose-1-phosphate maltosyltransferase [Neolewinella lacunae]|uniref:Alpha-1,4-glucan:maltose-1-phosphate maltosyltransferase n=1 Tax=Neolewinella lacunae TaxID=1517758 RepID=A0A923T6I1_9BACT|nr:alpha-1,4-glucan--maltose-1-phosphate maltosyltransferase [Neolewinella lacunae]MBC6993445.1 alpha-1,4-glucan--maltose-1-phosphate maltosyltransferase [Neolewinella lacunae]MDN3636279.1 alpha-1,4-glucan--maltose-1-phosphate maltosyltransferase [Neolewinella lacunae]
MQNRSVIDHVKPQINNGRFLIQRVVGESVNVSASIFGDGHDYLRAVVEYRTDKAKRWTSVEMEEHPNDHWTASFRVTEQTIYHYRLVAWVDQLLTWYRGFKKKHADGQDMGVEIAIGANLLTEALKQRPKKEQGELRNAIQTMGGEDQALVVQYILGPVFAQLILDYPLRRFETVYDHSLRVKVGRLRERFSSWYEIFPRSASPDISRSGTFKDVEALLPRLEEMGFDVLYMPPVHPIGRKNRKGRNNAVTAMEGEPGSPWAIGAAEGGHKAILPELGNIEDYKQLIKRAKQGFDIDVALDLAFQCAPDHPYITEHPEWFIWRPDGSIMYAENPPKKYQDIVPINFETEDHVALWKELLSVVIYWCEAGINIFRVDNPHTKPYRFWEYIIAETTAKFPDTIFLAEAFTRPAIMAELAKRGFQQSYTYFTWRTTPHEMREYLTELTTTELADCMQPNFWPNTPDILAYEMMGANSNQFVKRLLLAATLSSSYGLYGPSYELMENRGNTNGKEEYYDSEKYMVRHYDWSYRNRITDAYTLINRARKTNPALQQTNNIRFTGGDNPNLLSYVKWNDERTNFIWTIVNFDQHHRQGGHVSVPQDLLGHQGFKVTDLLTGAQYWWNGSANYVAIDPAYWPAHVFLVEF